MTGISPVGPGLAFLAGLLSFLSPCVLPLVPGYMTFITGLTLDELRETDGGRARRQAALHSALFVLGFSAVFLTLGATATVLGGAVSRSLPLLQQVGGVVVVLLGLYSLGWLRLGFLMRERRVHLAARPAGRAASVVAGVAFGAGWTPCVGPILATILLYAAIDGSMASGMGLLTMYALGLGLPFFLSAVGINWYLAGARRLRRWHLPMERAAGALLVVMGVMLLTGRFAALTGFLGRFGPLIDLAL